MEIVEGEHRHEQTGAGYERGTKHSRTVEIAEEDDNEWPLVKVPTRDSHTTQKIR